MRRSGGSRAAVLVIALWLVAGVRAAAQGHAAFGAQAGYSRADLSGGADQVERRQGAITGVYLHLPVNSLMSLRPELIFSVKGGRTLVRIRGGDIADLDIELAYLEMPVLARLVLPTGRFRPAIFGGPTLGLQIGCDFLFVVPDTTRRFTCGAEDNPFPVRDLDYGLIGGAAVEMQLPRTTLSLQGRYSAGFRSVLNDEDVDLRNRTVALLFALTF
jgi:Outer membrane protein beta-barrel domain